MNINKLVHEARGLCWHEWAQVNRALNFWHCSKCKAPGPTNPSGKNINPDYEKNMNACMELWEEGGMGSLRTTLAGFRVYFTGPGEYWALTLGPESETPQLAIINAYLKSKGVELPKGEE